MKAILMAVLVAVGPLAIAAEPGDDDDPHPSSISGDHLLESVISSFPATPVQITGTLHVRKRRGVVVETLGLDVAAEWSKERTHATYTIRDQAGQTLESMEVIREGDQPVVFSFQRAGVPQPPPTPALLSGAIHASDVSWTDLTLAFLWWRGSTIVGEDSVKGYDCTIVEVPAPANEAFHYRKARLWIAKRAPVLLKAEGLDAEGKTVRRLWVDNFKKQGDTWMVKDMEFQHYPIRHRTKLRIRKLELATP